MAGAMNLQIYIWTGIVTAITSWTIAFFVYFKNRKGLINKTFSLFTLSVGVWSLFWVKMISASSATAALLWAKLLSLGSLFIPVFFLHFICVISNIVKQKKKIIIANYIFALILLFFCFFTNLFIKGVEPIFAFNYHIQPGPIYIFHVVSFVIVAIYGEFLLFKASKIYIGLKRNQIEYLFWALMIGFLGGVTAFSPIYKIPSPAWAVNTISIGIIIIAYNIVKYRLMDITVAITRTGIFVAVYTFVLGLPFIIAVRFKDRLVKAFGPDWWIFPFGLLAVLATVGPFIYIYLQRKAENRLLKEQRRYQEILRQAAGGMTRIHNLDKLLNMIVQIVAENVRISHSVIYLFDEQAKKFVLKAGCKTKKGQPESIPAQSLVISWFDKHKQPLVYEEIKLRSEENPDPGLKELGNQMKSLNASVIIPSFLEDKLLNLLILGDKLSESIYTAEDLNIFSILGNQIAVAIENASLYQNIEEKVKQRTAELVQVQKQLIQAEKLATVGTLAGGVAHEINNPLTAILTNVQMLLTLEDGLEVDSKESLQLIEEATKRCRTIVQKLMTYAKKPLERAEVSNVDLLKVVQNVASFLGYQLEQENIKIIIDSKKDSHLVAGNQNEFEQALINFILNAKDAIKKVKKSGAIHITLLEDEDWIKLEIKDNGAGIPKEIMPKIFDPFFTTKDVGKGVGLGLSICQSIIEKHKGTIAVESEINKGAVFTVKLPKLRDESNLKTISA